MSYDTPLYKYNPSRFSSTLFLRTLSLATLKSSALTCILLSLKASNPASVHMALISAPDKSSFEVTSSSRFTSSAKLIFDVWIVKIFFLVLESGFSNKIFSSISPGLINAGSNDSILLVAIMTLMSPLSSNPSNWFNNSNIVLWISLSPPEVESYLLVPIASISSMKTIEGANSPAIWKICSHNLGPSPRMTPLGGLIPISSYSSGCVNGNSTASLISWICSSKPPMSAYDSVGDLSNFMTDTMGSASSCNTPTIDTVLWCKSTEHPGSNNPLSTKDKMDT